MSEDTPLRPVPGRSTRDIYGRKPTSKSRGKTHDRIMSMQRTDGTLPGAESILDAPADPAGSGVQAASGSNADAASGSNADAASGSNADATSGSNADATSIGGVLLRFLNEYVVSLPITSRRAYERSLVLLLRDLDESGPSPAAPLQELVGDRFVQHLSWRVRVGLDEPAELTRCAVQLGHLSEWLHKNGHAGLSADRDALRAAAASLFGDTA